MNIFALDSATAAGSVAIVRDETVVCEQISDGTNPHSVALMPLCDTVFRHAGLSPQDIDCYAVSAGPGSFTGLRIGMGIIKGLAFGVGKPCASVSTLETLAWGLHPSPQTAVAVLDARQGRVYTAGFALHEPIERLCPDEVLYIDQLVERYRGQSVVFVGDAAELCYNSLKDRMDCCPAAPEFLFPRASCVARAAALHGLFQSAAALRPAYLQLPQAQRQRLQQEGKT